MYEHLAVSDPGKPEKKESVKNHSPGAIESRDFFLPSLASPGSKLLPCHRRRFSKPFPPSGLHPGCTVPYVACTRTSSVSIPPGHSTVYSTQSTQPLRALRPQSLAVAFWLFSPSFQAPSAPQGIFPTLLLKPFLLPVDSFSVPLRNHLR